MEINESYELSTIHQSTVLQTKDKHSKGLYYNASYEVENFIEVVNDNSSGDVFKVLNDPTYTGFKIFFHFSDKGGLLADGEYTNSALAYLSRIGDYKRLELLKKYINILSKVNSITPWIFQEITGIAEIYNKPFAEPHRNHEIEIRTLETIDNKIMSLIEMYRNIVYDFDRHVYVLPENLRRFSMSIYIYDFRMFDSTSTTATELMQTLYNTDVRNLNHVMFDLHKCEFDIKSGTTYFSTVDANRTDANENNITINTKDVRISSLFKTITGDTRLSQSVFNLAKSSNSSLSTLADDQGSFMSKLDNKNFLNNTVKRLTESQLVQSVQERYNEYQRLVSGGYETQLKNIRTDITERAIQRVEGELTKLYLGNVHGFGFDDLLKLSQDDDFRTAFNQIYSAQSGTQSLKLGNTEKKTLGSI